jgi:Abnormal spindle-like microcephaly-assoc'd, ASPM-SPD-2-Hydin
MLLGIVFQVGCAGVTASPNTGGQQASQDAPAISLNPASVNFGSVVTGTTASQPIIISNAGSATLTITQASLTGSQFSMSAASMPLSIPAGQKAAVTIGFTPISIGSATGSVSITSNAPSSPTTLDLSGNGVAATHLLGANKSNLVFGTVTDGTSSSQSVILTNNGNSNVTISGVTTTGAGFSSSGVNAGMMLTPNQTATLSVTFDPSTPGAVIGGVMVNSDATDSPTSVSLSGTGSQGAASHTVALMWTASTSGGITSYNVYRGTTEGSYSRISSVSGTSFTDTTVESGQNITYFYVVTAVNAGGESQDSNVATATVP